MATKNVAWSSGTGTITVNYTGSGNGSIQISSSPNNLTVDRSQTITVKTTQGGTIAKNITVNQKANPNISGTKVSNYFIGAVDAGTTTMSPVASVDGKFIHEGTERSNANMRYDKYSIIGGEKYYFSAYYGTGWDVYAIHYYDSSNNYIGRENYKGSSTSETIITNQAIYPPSNAAYLCLNVIKVVSSSYYNVKSIIWGIGRRSGSSFAYYVFPVTAGKTYYISAPAVNNADAYFKPISFGTGITSDIVTNGVWYDNWTAAHTPFSGNISIPSGKTYMYITTDINDSAPVVQKT